MSTWKYQAIGVVLLLAAAMLIPGWGPYEIALWFFLLLVVLLAPPLKRWWVRRQSTAEDHRLQREAC